MLAARFCRSISEPVFVQQPVHALELAQVVTDQSQTFTAGMGSNMQVIHADRCTSLLQGGSDLAIVLGCLGAVIKDIQLAAEIFYNCKGSLRLRTLFCAMLKGSDPSAQAAEDPAIEPIQDQPKGAINLVFYAATVMKGLD